MNIPSSPNKHTRLDPDRTLSPGRAQAIFGLYSHGGIAFRPPTEIDFDSQPITPADKASDYAHFAQQKEEFMIDFKDHSNKYTITEHTSLLSCKNLYGSTSSYSESDNLEPVSSSSSLWNNSVDNQLLSTTSRREILFLAKSSLPLTITFMLQYSLTVASVFSVGHLGKTELGAVSLAAMTANITGFAIIQGLATCLDTLCAQAYGAGCYHQVGQYFQKGTLMIMAFFVPVGILWLNAGPILNYIVQDAALVDLSLQYLKIIMLGVPAFIAFECGKRFLQAQGIFHATTIVLVICAPTNAILNYVLVWSPTIGLGFIGAPLAVAISNWLMATMLLLFVFFIDGKKCWGGFSIRAFQKWGDMVCLAVPGLIMIEAEFLAYEVLTLSASRFGTTALATQSIIATVMSFQYQIPLAVGIGASTRVANFIGASQSGSAKITTEIAILISGLIGAFDCSVCYYFRCKIGSAFSSDKDVIELVARLVPVMMCCHFFDAPCAILAGILRGIGRQRVGGCVNLTLFYALGLPLSLLFGFGWGTELRGLWMGMLFAIMSIAVCELIYLYNCNWDKIVEEAEHRKHRSCEAALA
jgi:MATE family multidrug resistance protein